MSRRTDLFALAATVVAFAWVLGVTGPDPTAVRIFVGVPLVALLPGHALMLAVDPKGRLGGLEWFAASVASSLSITALVGLVVADSPWGFTPAAWLTALCGITLLFILMAAWPGRTSALALPPHCRATARYLPVAALLLGGFGVLFVALTPVSLPSDRGGDVLQLWAQHTAQGRGMRFTIANLTRASSEYSLKIAQGGEIISEHSVNVAAGGEYALDMESSAIQTTDTPVVAVLSDAEGVVVRRVSIWPTE